MLRVRHHSLFTPRDFDISPYFAIIKPTIDGGFDYQSLIWGAPCPVEGCAIDDAPASDSAAAGS